MVDQISFLIVGNGIAGVTAAETLRNEAPEATIGVISEDAHPVYFRPALKDYLAGRVAEEKLWARPAKYYEGLQIHYLSERVRGIYPSEHLISLQSGGQVRYEQLLLASGARPARLTCPGSDLRGVLTLRSVEDYRSALERLPRVRRVVVCGSGTLALETVETLRHRGLDVTHLIRKKLIWSEVLDATASDLVIQEELRAGVDVCLGTEIIEIIGARGSVVAVKTNSGEQIACELVLIAIGIEPNIDYVKSSSIACRRGVYVDAHMRTSAPDVYAAGDVVETVNQSTSQTRVIGQWYPAIQQARAAAYSMLGILDVSQPFHAETFYNATFLYGLPFASIGITNAQGYREVIAEPRPRSYRKVLLRDGVPVGMLALGDRKHTLAFKRAIDHRVPLDAVVNSLMHDDFDLIAYLDGLHVPPLQLGVRKQGDTGANPAIVALANKGAGQDVEGPMLNELVSSEQTEAFLVHIVDANLPLRVAEAPLSRQLMLTVGRQPGVDLMVNEASVSRRHALVGYSSGKYQVRDLGSLNGTFLNGERLEAERLYALNVNDTLRIGNVVTFRFLLRTLNLSNLSPAGSAVSTQQKTPASVQASQPVAQSVPVRATDLQLVNTLLPLSAAQPLPPAIVNALKKTPALIILPPSVHGEQKQHPQVYLLQDKRSVKIGRDASNDISLNDLVVSRQHAEVFLSSSFFYIHDVGSSNGISVNQSPIDQPYRLAHGDHILLGNTIIFFVDLQSGQEKTSKLKKFPHTPVSPREPRTAPKTLSRPGVNTQARVPTVPAQHPFQTSVAPVKVVLCPHCGVVNMPVARFCAGCSQLLNTSGMNT
ncbi:FAD-dependent oxidoreductase [Dictyobacter arantiisoli]|uniref:FHA domain-containing protein n=1 Tax=Dictyobacter arantiisoli TaxID=2014874 RepID=A0A5A5T740_9CHLR|nr:FAD-dependent oxidoreductase [Dictyobacter arantiisoli]GCF06754.1 hypothetical protein KDI_03180 [Dictyobacter arantiisoli]